MVRGVHERERGPVGLLVAVPRRGSRDQSAIAAAVVVESEQRCGRCRVIGTLPVRDAPVAEVALAERPELLRVGGGVLARVGRVDRCVAVAVREGFGYLDA